MSSKKVLKEKLICPNNCGGGYAHRIDDRILPRDLNMTTADIQAAGILTNTRISRCGYCDCIWKKMHPYNYVIIGKSMIGGPFESREYSKI